MFQSYYDYVIIKSTHYNKNDNNESPEIDRNETYQSKLSYYQIDYII